METLYPRTEYEMTEAQERALLDACKPVAAMMIGGVGPSSPQENANRAWAALGAEMGFQPETVRPVQGKGQRFFSAVPSETPEQRAQREARQAEEAKRAEVDRLTTEIAERETRLAELRGDA